MADISVTTTQVGIVDPANAEVVDFQAGETITVGQAVYIDSNGRAGIADANTAGKQQFRGIAVKVQGNAVSVLKKGRLYGYDLSSMAYDAIAYLSDTAGSLADAASITKTVNCGRVVPLSDSDRTKVLYVEADWLRDW